MDRTFAFSLMYATIEFRERERDMELIGKAQNMRTEGVKQKIRDRV